VGLYQINFQAPTDMPRGTFALVANTKDGSSQTGILAPAEGVVALSTADLGLGVKMEFVSIPAGEFMMGRSPGDTSPRNDELPVHRVQITKSFQMGQYEVTQAQWQAIMGSDPSYYKGAVLPVEEVSWNDVQQFLTRLNGRNDGYRYRLPTEAEWEYAARAGSTDKYAGGVLDEISWHLVNSSFTTHPIGEKKPNAWRLYDMLGNVSEWCQDLYGSYLSGTATDPTGPSSGSQRTLRGSSFFDFTGDLRVLFRNYDSPTFSSRQYGFRCVRER
jgi:formylglycine-generating enzyme required for sulfatase activity